ncbi:unnamed protein product [Nippostrongylus brasiliensis]|uniref:Uncharacterized protein n=1 Tax=Nippostrongylus brasiliensis TaxID=27835 RepID=A0A0N4XS18_NIPBR|nr:unnamed protein product [Nippostrongylus brasiliensis]
MDGPSSSTIARKPPPGWTHGPESLPAGLYPARQTTRLGRCQKDGSRGCIQMVVCSLSTTTTDEHNGRIHDSKTKA